MFSNSVSHFHTLRDRKLNECINNGPSPCLSGILRNDISSDSAVLMSVNILKRNNITSSLEARQLDLLVFGYACKVFRDDTKALEIDQGRHLIPWMGDASLKIDRYDVRGALCELAIHEPPPGGYGNRLDYLTPDEQRAEQLCEEERYLFLCKNEEDNISLQEEELKRLRQETNGNNYNEMKFSYDKSNNLLNGFNNEENFKSLLSCKKNEDAFKMPHNFEVPLGVKLPDTMKQHVIIEKTARFIAEQGLQMEILLKAKQSNNIHFEFLSPTSLLNSYYKHILNACKTGTYSKIVEDNSTTQEKDFVRTTLPKISSTLTKSIITVPPIKYKPSADCAYTQLISKIKGIPLPDCITQNKITMESHNMNSEDQILQHSSLNPLDVKCVTPALLQDNSNNDPPKSTETMINREDIMNNSTSLSSSISQYNKTDSGIKVEIIKNTSAFALAQIYNSDSDSNVSEKSFQGMATPLKHDFQKPADNLRNIIDKTALYVIKNGRKFEDTLLTKSEERFKFLLPESEFYPYYLYKVTGDPNAASKEQKQRKAAAVAAALLSKKGISSGKTISPVSFSIKAKDESNAYILTSSILTQDNSAHDIELNKRIILDKSSKRFVPEQVQKAIQFVESQLMARNVKLTNVTTASIKQQKHAASKSQREKLFKIKSNTELNVVNEQQKNKLNKMEAEDKVKDKLVQIAREKLGGLISKEKQLQRERKRKAMAFLYRIKGFKDFQDDSRTVHSKYIFNLENDNEENCEDTSDKCNSIEDLIPINSYGPESDIDEDMKNSEKMKISKITPSAIQLIKTEHCKLKENKIDHNVVIQKIDNENNTINSDMSFQQIMISEDEHLQLLDKTHNNLSFTKQCFSSDSNLNRRYEKGLAKYQKKRVASVSKSPTEDKIFQERVEKHYSASSIYSYKQKKSKVKKKSKSKSKAKKRSHSKSEHNQDRNKVSAGSPMDDSCLDEKYSSRMPSHHKNNKTFKHRRQRSAQYE